MTARAQYDKAGLERAVAFAMRLYQGSGKFLGAHLVLDWGVLTIGQVVLWTRFGMIVRCCLQMGSGPGDAVLGQTCANIPLQNY